MSQVQNLLYEELQLHKKAGQEDALNQQRLRDALWTSPADLL